LRRKLVIDGYNVLHRWKSLKKLVKKDFDFAREELIRLINNYTDYADIKAVIVFDGGEFQKPEGNLDASVVYTKKRESADHYIERLVYQAVDRSRITVATNDRMLQNMIQGMGAFFMSTENLERTVESELDTMRKKIKLKSSKSWRSQ